MGYLQNQINVISTQLWRVFESLLKVPKQCQVFLDFLIQFITQRSLYTIG